MAKVIGFFAIILAIFLLAGCLNNNQDAVKNPVNYSNTTPACEHGNAEGCDRSCNSNLDCQESPAGCINLNEYFDNKGIEISIKFISCHCVNGLCTED